MMKNFSSRDRSKYLDALEKYPVDLLVIGGGITGAGIALDAQVRGIQTGLIDMQDFAAGTSSRSTKLIHGGLRYLKQFEVKLVAEVGKERAIVYENAPHVTKPIWMMLPIYKNGTFGYQSTSFGLRIYDFLADVKKIERRYMLRKEETIKKEPLIRQDGLIGAGVYVEYRTDDARLTIEVVKEAVHRGAIAVNYTKAQDFLYKNGKVVGIQIMDLITREERKIYAKRIVNASGPWVDRLRDKDHSQKVKSIHLTKGVHIVIDRQKIPLTNALYFDTPFGDGRMLFAIPRENKVYIGTTDTTYHDDLIHPRATEKDLQYILSALNFVFPSLHVTTDDIESSWCGLRPLIHEEGKDPSAISRKDEIFLSDSGLITIAGGKLTGYRKMAEKVVDLVRQQLKDEEGLQYPDSSTKHVILSGGDVGGAEGYASFISKQISAGMDVGLDEKEAITLIRRYGSNSKHIFDFIHHSKEEANTSGLPLAIWASLIYGIEHEMVVTPSDYFIRRTGALFFHIKWVNQWKSAVITFMSTYLQWSEKEEDYYRDELERHLHEAVVPLSMSK
ncbi:glycerol-3-phosphate dehydrogenase/oxidase [Bacillus sp. 03113]|uniref:glycerol-3-phosphate dehydrogenase/oxidase n=1 Tax=Bacillus sp. 03113 TaxID=2578211 RepID=UPI0011442A6A|nr:FAD-dependent oxidoreductase [Bacillus sp. 03113]